jgi:hypothetical protein
VQAKFEIFALLKGGVFNGWGFGSAQPDIGFGFAMLDIGIAEPDIGSAQPNIGFAYSCFGFVLAIIDLSKACRHEHDTGYRNKDYFQPRKKHEFRFHCS